MEHVSILKFVQCCLKFIQFRTVVELYVALSNNAVYSCRDESEWWIFPFALVLCKCIQLQLLNWHVANLEIQDRSLYSNDFELFWQS